MKKRVQHLLVFSNKTIRFILISILSITSYTLWAQESTPEPVKNVIIMIGDGMGLAQTYAAYTVNKEKLNIFQFPVTGLLLTYSSDNYITDSAAGGTAFACGKKTKNGYLGKDETGKDIKNLFEIAKEKSLSTGLVVTCAITHATPAAFYAHVSGRNDYEKIAIDFTKSNIDVAIGGGKKYFQNRSDKKNLINDLQSNGYHVSYTIDQINQDATRNLCLLADEDLPTVSAGRGNVLAEATSKALQILSKNNQGFILMVEGSQIDWGGHANDIDYVVKETIDFDKAVGVALEFARENKNTLVLVIADHETGGLSITGGNITEGKIDTHFASNNHTALPVIVYAFGPSNYIFTGVYQNTDIFFKIKQLLKL